MRMKWLAVGLAAIGAALPAKAGTYSVLYSFPPFSSSSILTAGTQLAVLRSGSLIGTAHYDDPLNRGVIYTLDPPLSGQTNWRFSIIFDSIDLPVSDQQFDFYSSYLGPVDEMGNVYVFSTSVLPADEGAGAIYRLSPPAPGAVRWTCTLLSLHGRPGETFLIPRSLFYVDHDARHVYGVGFFSKLINNPNPVYSTATAIFRLDLPSGLPAPNSGILNVISPTLSANNPRVIVLPARNGLFYGQIFDVSGAGTVIRDFQFKPPVVADAGAKLGELQLLPTSPSGSLGQGSTLTVDLSDRLTGADSSSFNDYYGSIVRLTPPASPGGTWQRSVLYSFKSKPTRDGVQPGMILLSPHGLFYGISGGGFDLPTIGGGAGTLFELAAPAPGSPSTPWSEQVQHRFGSTASDGTLPFTLIQSAAPDGTYALYGVTGLGGAGGSGTVFRYVP